MATSRGNCHVCGRESPKGGTGNRLKAHNEGIEECFLVKNAGFGFRAFPLAKASSASDMAQWTREQKEGKAMEVTKGNCYFCGEEVAEASAKSHLGTHAEGTRECILVKAEGTCDNDYWIYFTIGSNSTLKPLDSFLRKTWCECCGHLSAFMLEEKELGMSRKISSLPLGVTFDYEYDFGSTTSISVTLVEKTVRQSQRDAVQLLARNIAPELLCDRCEAPATLINTFEEELLCEKCARLSLDDKDKEDDDEYDDEYDDGMLPVTNSPRIGECAYCGESDVWAFDPTRLYKSAAPRTPIKRKRNTGYWVKVAPEQPGAPKGKNAKKK